MTPKHPRKPVTKNLFRTDFAKSGRIKKTLLWQNLILINPDNHRRMCSSRMNPLLRKIRKTSLTKMSMKSAGTTPNHLTEETLAISATNTKRPRRKWIRLRTRKALNSCSLLLRNIHSYGSSISWRCSIMRRMILPLTAAYKLTLRAQNFLTSIQ